jgi:hypothetical protein
MKNRKSLTFTTHHNKCSKLCIFCLKKKLCIFIKIKKKINTFASKTTPIKITTNNQVFGQSKSESSLPQKKKSESYVSSLFFPVTLFGADFCCGGAGG